MPAWYTGLEPHSSSDPVQPPYCCGVIIVRHDLPFGDQEVASGTLHCAGSKSRHVQV
ncbi:hypothetical protein V8C26DRAFT_3362 [Trichoderma gracile]